MLFRKKCWLLAIVFMVVLSLAAAEDRAKYVFLFVGDGMGENIRKFYQNEYPDSSFEKFPVIVRTGTNNYKDGLTDSAASGTAIACGIKTYNGAVGVDANGRPVTSLAKIMRDKGYSVGIITSVGLNDATPGAHYANRLSRKDYMGVMSDLYASDFDFFAGGYLLPEVNKKNKEAYPVKDYGKLLKLVKYDLVTKYEFNEKTPKKRVVFLGSMEPKWPKRGVDRHFLKEVTEFAISSLEKNPKGFFMLIEGGAIDHRAHGNDLAGTMRETRELDMAVRSALDFWEKHPRETLIVVTSDHDTGGLNIDAIKKADLWQKQPNRAGDVEYHFKKRLKKDSDEQLIKFLADYFFMGELTADEMKSMQEAMKVQRDPQARKKKNYRSMYRSYNPVVIQMMRLRDARHGVSWTGFNHTNRKVLTNAQGAGQDYFKNVKENSDISHAISMAVFGEDVMKKASETLPYLVVGRMEEYFNFITLNSHKAVFRYGQKKASELEFVFAGSGVNQTVKRSDRAGRITFEDLKPASEYTLTVKRDGKVLVERKIKTLPLSKGQLLARIGVIADPHVSLIPDVHYGRMHSKSAATLGKACQALAAQKVDFIALPGDITDASKLNELKAVCQELKKTPQMKFYGIPGNHDRLHKEDFKKLWLKTFGDTARLEKHGNLQILLLDTGNGRLMDKPGNIQAMEALDPALPVVVFSHYQLIPDTYMTDKDRAIHDADKAQDMLKKLSGMKGVILVGHKNVATTAQLGGLLQINMPQLTQFPAGCSYAEVYTDGVRLEFQPMLDEFFDEYGRLRSNAMGQKAKSRDKNSLKIWNAFYPMDLAAGK